MPYTEGAGAGGRKGGRKNKGGDGGDKGKSSQRDTVTFLLLSAFYLFPLSSARPLFGLKIAVAS